MNTSRPLVFVGVLVLLSAGRLSAQEPAVDEVNALVNRFKGEFAALEASEDASGAPYTAAYVKAIERLWDAAKAKGDLNGLIEIEPAREAIRQGKSPPATKTGTSAVAVARATYEKGKADARRLTQPRRERLEANYLRSFNELEQRFTRIGDLEAARLARKARLSVHGDATDILPTMLGKKESREGFVISRDEEGLKSEVTFQPPIEIEFTFKTSDQVRISYAAKQIIFNWEVNKNELRIDGGPASGQHQARAGAIPTKQLVTIKQVVLPGSMTVSVDGRERGRWNKDFSGVDDAIGIRGTHGAFLEIQQISVRKLNQKP